MSKFGSAFIFFYWFALLEKYVNVKSIVFSIGLHITAETVTQKDVGILNCILS